MSYLTALDNKELFSQLDGIFADGGLLVKAIKMVYGKQVTRRSFDMISMDPELFVYVAKHGKLSISWLRSGSRWRRPWRYFVMTDGSL